MQAITSSGTLWSIAGYLALGAVIIAFVTEFRKSRWSKTGLVVALSSGLVAAIHSQTFADFGKCSQPSEYLFGMFRINAGPAVTWISALVYLVSFGAMIVALQSRSGRGMWIVAAVCVYCLLGLGGTAFMMMLSGLGSIQFRLGGQMIELPPIVGALLLAILLVGPFIVGLPWAIQHSVADSSLIGRDILRRYAATLGLLLTAFVLLAIMLVSSQLYEMQEAAQLQRPYVAPNYVGELLPLVITLGLLLTMSVATLWFFRRNFLLPAISLLEGASKPDQEINLDGLNSLWQPWAEAINAGRAELKESKALLDAFFQNAPNPMCLITPTGEYVMINGGAARYYGKSPDELLEAGQEGFYAPFPEAQTQLAPMAARVIANRKAESMESHAVMPSGEVRNFGLWVFPIFGDNGEIAYLGSIAHDVTEERRAQAEASKTQALFQAFIQHSPNAMLLIEPTGKLVMVNNAAAGYFGETPEKLLAGGETAFSARFPEVQSLILPAFARVVENLQFEQVDTKFEMPSGEIREFSFSFFPILGPSGELAHIGSICFDLTDGRRAQADLARSTAALHQSEKLAALGQLLAGVAHELNNPLAIVLGRAAILKDKLADSPYADSIQKLRDAAERCARIVKTFLAMARQTGPRRSAVQLNELIEGALDMIAYGLRTADIELKQELDPALPIFDADEDQIVQLLINLIVNAQHALEGQPGERHLTIRTWFEKATRLAVIEVADNGPGVSTDLATRIFEPFFTTKGVGEGTGLGLSVCKGMVEAHGGTLTLHETSDGGATFRATFPLITTVSPHAVSNSPEAKSSSGHILIVDDEPEIAAILADCLAPLGVSCAIASDGHAALSLVNNTQFDAVFCDVRMPRMDGIAFLAKLKTEHPELAKRLAFVSGDVLHRDLARLRAASDRPIIEKPFDPQLVRDTAMLLLAPAGETQ